MRHLDPPIPTPTAYVDLMNWLADSRFEVQRERYDADAFGDWEMILGRSPLEVHIFRHKSQWFLEVGGQQLDGDQFDMDVWKACLTGEAPPLALSAFAEEARLCEELLARMEAALTQETGAAIRERLAELRRRRGSEGLAAEIELIKREGWDSKAAVKRLGSRVWPEE
jgi:hypothetical protein